MAHVCSLGTIHNIFVANHKRSPSASGVPLRRFNSKLNTEEEEDTEYAQRDVRGYACVEIGHPEKDSTLSTMDVLKLAEQKYAGLGLLLLKTFFPGDIDQEEVEFWRKQRETLSSRRLGLKKILDSKTRILAMPPTKRRPPLFSRTSSSISWRGLTGKGPHRHEPDPERGARNSTKQTPRENARRKGTDGSSSNSAVTGDRIATQDFGQQKTGSRVEITDQNTPQSPISSSPRRSHESAFLPINESNEFDATSGEEEYFSESGPRSLYPVISMPEPAETGTVVEDSGHEDIPPAGASVGNIRRVSAVRAQSYTGAPSRYPRSARPSAFRSQTGYAASGAEPVPGLTTRARTFTFPTNSI